MLINRSFSYCFLEWLQIVDQSQRLLKTKKNNNAANGTETKPALHELKATAKPTVKQTKWVREKDEITS